MSELRGVAASMMRALELHLTETGQRAAVQLAKARQATFARLVAALPEAQRERVTEALGMLVEALHESH